MCMQCLYARMCNAYTYAWKKHATDTDTCEDVLGIHNDSACIEIAADLCVCIEIAADLCVYRESS